MDPGFNLQFAGGSLIFSVCHTLLGMWPSLGGKQGKLPRAQNFEEELILKFMQVLATFELTRVNAS